MNTLAYFEGPPKEHIIFNTMGFERLRLSSVEYVMGRRFRGLALFIFWFSCFSYGFSNQVAPRKLKPIGLLNGSVLCVRSVFVQGHKRLCWKLLDQTFCTLVHKKNEEEITGTSRLRDRYQWLMPIKNYLLQTFFFRIVNAH